MKQIGLCGVLAAGALLVAGCSSSAQPQPPSATTPPKATQTASPTASRKASQTTSSSRSRSPANAPKKAHVKVATKVLVVIEENHSLDQMKAGMPFLSKVSDRYGYATSWTALAHPSEPNYLAIAGGSTFGITDDAPPAAHSADVGSATSVFDQALAAGKTAVTYAESMPSNCYLSDSGPYAVKHNPWAFFQTSHQSCTRNDVPLKDFSKVAAADALPNVGFLIPNLDHDAHDGSLAAADTWLEQQLRPVLASDDFTTGRLVVVVTADEDDHNAGNTVLTSVLTPALSGKVVDTPLTHYSLTRYIAQVLGVTPLRNGRDAPDMKAAFGL